MKLENAINYRLVSQILGNYVANEYGYSNDSYGYKELERKFANDYSVISLNQYKEEIALAYVATYSNKKRVIKSMAQVLGEKECNEEQRYLFSKTCKKVNNQNKENALAGIPNKIIDNNELLVKDKVNIDNIFYQIIKICRKYIKNPKISQNELELSQNDLINMYDYISKIKDLQYELGFDYLDMDTFEKSILEKHIEKIEQTDITKRNYTEQTLLEIKTEFTARLETVSENSQYRRKTKETIFDKINYSKVKKMSNKDFSKEYKKMIELYNEIGDMTTLEDIVKFYNIESKYNLLFYRNVVMDLVEVFGDFKENFERKISRLTVLDFFLHRHHSMRSVINELIFNIDKEDNKEYDKKLFNEISRLVKIKDIIVRDLLRINNLNPKELEEEILNLISPNSRKEIVKQINNLDIQKNYHNKNELKILKKLKYLLVNNQEIVIERGKIKNTIK